MQQLNPVDAAFLRMESPSTPMHIGVLMTFRLPEDAGPDYLRQLAAYMRSQPVVTPPFSYELARGAGRRIAPTWIESPDIDLDYHLRHSALPYPGGERELGVLVARLHSQPLDLTRPPWECHLIEGLENRRFAIYLKAHHAAMDGMATLRLVRLWLSDDPAKTPGAGPWAIEPKPSAQAGSPDAGLRSTRDQLMLGLRSAAELTATLRRMARRKDNPEGGILSALATPRTVLNQNITAQRRLATQLYAVARFKALTAATGSTINDISLAICGGAIRRYLLELDALPEKTLIASIPIGLPRADGKPGNAVAGFVCPLATEQDDPLLRLKTIHAITRRTKEQLKTLSPTAMEQFSLLGISPLILGQLTGLATRFRPLFNVVVSNVVASREKLYFRGAELEALYPMSVLFDGYALNVTVIGYADGISIGFTGCRDTVPSLQKLAVYTGEALLELERACGLAPRARPASRSRKTAS